MKTYQLYWGDYLQWTRQFASDEEAIRAATFSLGEERKWRLVKLEVIYQR